MVFSQALLIIILDVGDMITCFRALAAGVNANYERIASWGVEPWTPES